MTGIPFSKGIPSEQDMKDLAETNWGGYTPSPAEIEQDRQDKEAEHAWRAALWEDTKQVLNYDEAKKIATDQWAHYLGESKYAEIGGWDTGGLFLTMSWFGVHKDCEQGVWAQIGYMKLAMNPEWSSDRFLRFTYHCYQQALRKYRDKGVESTQEWYRNRYLGIRNTFEAKGGPSPKPEAFGTWS